MTKEQNYCVYCHTCPNGKVYYGVTKNAKKRWCPSHYRNGTPFKDAIIEFGWKNIKHEVLYSGLTRDEALKIEDSLITDCWNTGMCLNKYRSGHYQQTEEFKEETRTRNKVRKEYHKIYMREWRKRNKK